MNEGVPGFPVAELDYELPPELIAQSPAAERSDSRLLVFDRTDGSMTDRRFADLPTLLTADDLLVTNNTRVIPARFELRRATGGRIDGLFLHEPEVGVWEVMLKNAARVKPGERLDFVRAGVRAARGDSGLASTIRNPVDATKAKVSTAIRNSLGQGQYVLRIDPPRSAIDVLSEFGRPPLPPYIRRQPTGDERDVLDTQRYQTVYARRPGAVAAPTAGLHFTPVLLDELAQRGVGRVEVTLHVGMGTFAPVTVDDLRDHEMHAERYVITEEAAERISSHRARGGRILAVGTTSARVLESCVSAEGDVRAGNGWTSIFCYPPYRFRSVDALITNFHLPRSTLLALVMAFAGIEPIRRAYQHAIEARYRFYSYGDAMLIR